MDITRAVGPPRAAFVDYRLGHTAGKPGDPDDQREVVAGALGLLETATRPGTISDLGRSWTGDPGWRDSPLSAGTGKADGRSARSPVPVYQNEQDRLLAESRHGSGAACTTCIGAVLQPGP